jgi:endonuclease/exonuclease/phosphatase family metal-dependent hydrolase
MAGERTRIGSFNVENMFSRAKAMNHETWAEGKEVLAAYARLSELIQLEAYDQAAKDEMLVQLGNLGLLEGDESEQAWLRKIRGRFILRPRNKPGQPQRNKEIVASGRADWIGWIELKTEPVTELASQHTARVMKEIGADVLGVVEAESRPLLKMFSETVLEGVGWSGYDNVFLLDGNDHRGIDVGLLARNGHTVTALHPHIYDTDRKGSIFSRDCAEYHLAVPGGHHLVVLVNHFKSKGYGSAGDPTGAQRRFRQAAAVARIYKRLVRDGVKYLAVVGDLNDDPSSEALEPLLGGTNLRDISTHPDFDWAGRKGTYTGGNEKQKIDYVLLSPALFKKATGGAVFRQGVWRGRRTRNPWPIFDTLTRPADAASDHAAIYADIAWE